MRGESSARMIQTHLPVSPLWLYLLHKQHIWPPYCAPSMGQLTDTRPLATAALLAFILCAVSSCSAHEQLERKIASAAVWASNIDSRSLDISAPSILARAMSHAEVSSVKRTRDGFEILVYSQYEQCWLLLSTCLHAAKAIYRFICRSDAHLHVQQLSKAIYKCTPSRDRRS